MTGEITLRGKVLPVGGIKEKILAAKRAGITDIFLCQENKKGIDQIKDIYLEGLTFHYVNTIQDVLTHKIELFCAICYFAWCINGWSQSFRQPMGTI